MANPRDDRRRDEPERPPRREAADERREERQRPVRDDEHDGGFGDGALL